MKLSTKLLIAFIGAGILPLLIAGLIAIGQSSRALEEKAIDQLVSVRDMKNQEVSSYFGERQANLATLVETVEAWQDEALQKLIGIREAKRGEVKSYFSFIENQVLTFSRNAMVVDAMETLPGIFRSADTENALSESDISRMRDAVERYYKDAFGEVYSERNGSPPDVSALLAPLDRDSIVLQYHYIAANANPLGSKEVLDAASDGSAYSAYHANLHPIVRDYLQRFEYYDIFLVDAESGDIVYSVFKELDYSTSLKDGPYAKTNFARAFQMANELEDPDDFVIVDYEPYGPSYEAPASFIASPVFKGNQRLGVAIFQMPIDRLNRIMSTRAGLGTTGETYLVGPDNLMRSNSYLDPENRSVEASFARPKTGSVTTVAATSALKGIEDSGIITDYNDNLVLSAYSPLEVVGFKWAIIAEIDVAEAFNPKQLDGTEFYSNFIERNDYYDLLLIGANGDCFYSVEREAEYGTNLLTGPYRSSGLGGLVREILAQPSFTIVDFEPYAPSGGAPAAFVGMPLLGGGKVELVVALQLSPRKLNTIMQTRSGMGSSGETYLVGPDFRMRSDSYLDPEGRSIIASFAGTVEKNGINTISVRKGLDGEKDLAHIMDYNGNKVLSAYAPLAYEGLNWALVAEIDEAEAFAAVKKMRASMGLIALICIGVIIVFALWIVRSITRPIMTAAEGITNASRETGSASGQVSSASQSLAEGASEQAASLEQSSSSIQEMHSMIISGAGLAKRTTGNALSASQSANRGQSTMNELRQRVDVVITAAREMEAAMAEIKESSDAISHIIKTIDEIAFQTNILALNAAVEAARAGEAGAGFAVVADEVRSLAGRASEAASQTANMIKRSVDSSKRGVDVNQTVASHLEEVLAKALEVDTGLKDIVGEVSQVSSAMQELESSTEEQVEGISQINTAIAQVNEVTQQSAASAEEAASASEEMNAQANQLQEIVDELTRVISGKNSGSSAVDLQVNPKAATRE